ncbi:hypothetical protein L2E82_33469 [Cichorium intybus]|uniref:Uncharacterized protein n=1 Tax=Cichorium intybus TaxID=13427 RepID=A0ACB9BK85_CICIN|nr:hypothetical protein L2E82_33469 [Cichorium intybus]
MEAFLENPNSDSIFSDSKEKAQSTVEASQGEKEAVTVDGEKEAVAIGDEKEAVAVGGRSKAAAADERHRSMVTQGRRKKRCRTVVGYESNA